MQLTIMGGGNAAPLTMSSLEIAGLVDSRHDKVKQSIERLSDRGVITLPPLGEVSNPGPGPRQIVVYHLGKRDSLVVVAQLCPEFTARIVDRWQELEQQAANATLVPANLSRLQLIELAMQAEQERLALESKVVALAPKAEALDRIADAEGAMNLTLAAKNLQIQPRRLTAWLRENQWIYRRPGGAGNVAYQTRIQSGYLTHKVSTIERSDGSEKVVEQVLVTGKGLAKLSQALAAH